ncbi:MAG: hypothetical protein R3281_06880 [Balneolaceae bacterium]|nr:hypothetical protein [Balneolaceae bacterium]
MIEVNQNSNILPGAQRATVFLILLTFISVTRAPGQHQARNMLDRMIGQADSLVQVTAGQASIIERPAAFHNGIMLLREGLAQDMVEPEHIPGNNVLQAEIGRLKSDKGLSFEAGYLENIDRSLFGSGGVFYDRRYQAGLRWDILDGGWLEHLNEAETLAREQQVAAHEFRKEHFVQEQRELATAVEVMLIRRQMEQLDYYIQAMQVREMHYRQLHLAEYASRHQLQAISGRLSVLKDHYRSLSGQVALISPSRRLNVEGLPVMDLDPYPVEHALSGSSSREMVDSLRLRNIRDRNSAWRELSLTASLRYNYYDNSRTGELIIPESGGRDYVSFGISVSVPFSVFGNHQREMTKAHRAEFALTRDLRLQEQLHTFRHLAAEYQSLLHDYSRNYHEHQALASAIQRDLMHAGPEELEYSPPEVQERIFAQFELNIKRIDITRKLYRKLFQIRALVPELPVSSYLRPWSPEPVPGEQRYPDGAIFWSDQLRNPQMQQ